MTSPETVVEHSATSIDTVLVASAISLIRPEGRSAPLRQHFPRRRPISVTVLTVVVASLATSCCQVEDTAFVSKLPSRALVNGKGPTRATSSVVSRQARGGGVNNVADPWKELGVEPGAKLSEIKRAYRRRALKEHPDVNKEADAKERWQKLSEAYDILSDPAKQKAWEAAKASGFGGGGGGRARRTWSGGGGQKGARQQAMDEEYDTGGDNLGSIFGDFLEGLGRDVSGEGGGGTVGKAKAAGSRVLEELLDFLDGGDSAREDDLEYDGSKPEAELNFARAEVESLKQLEETLKTEAETWEKKAEVANAAADNVEEEKRAMRKLFDARDRRSNIRRRALQAVEKVEYLEKVVFEVKKKREAREKAKSEPGSKASSTDEVADGPGAYTILHAGTKVAATAELSEEWVAELNTGAVVQVLEIDKTKAKGRLRGRLELGWVSIVNTDTGYRFARRNPSADKQTGGAASGGSTAGDSRGARNYDRARSTWAEEQERKQARRQFDADAALNELKNKKAR